MTGRLRALLVAAALTTSLPALAPAATADPLDLTCAGTETVTYSPGLLLTPTPQTIGVNHVLAPCIPATVPGPTSGTTSASVQRTASCLDLAEPGTGQTTITWNTGQSSTFTYNRTVTNIGGNAVTTLTGAITSGLFTGDAAVSVITGPTINPLDCLHPGLTRRTGVVTLTITGT
ncbi:hypothetical protein [Saccharothrix syringae]|uniref:Ig-like domain-containing protein n=1 Tax=Saccharothrix syringae TaxID=103733 RepID=A0A5Q0H441_SACSY|nr:hypothetical protein [Saccharothrix syringae]QFZ20889.1 hypothetical protein EKG83_28995 [Saccharothrix syringae]